MPKINNIKTFASTGLLIALLFNYITGFTQVISGTFAIKNIQTDMVLRIEEANRNNGTALVAYNPVNWKCVTWEFNHVENNTYQLKNLYTGKTFQPVEAVSSIYLEQQPLLVSKKSQLYEFISVADNQYLIRLKDTDQYLAPSDT
ncbi:MAG: RICIN domain-containing protein, partial [Chitinophagaceae bacterium]